MAAPSNKSARKLSSFFSLKPTKDEHPLPPTPPLQQQQPSLSQEPHLPQISPLPPPPHHPQYPQQPQHPQYPPPPHPPPSYHPLQHPLQPAHARGSSEGFAMKPNRTTRLIKSSSIPNLPSLRPDSPETLPPPPINTSVLSPLVPPPAIVNYGPPRPASSQGSVGSRPDSRPGSRAASREGSRSRPSTPSNMGPPSANNSPVGKVAKDPKGLKRMSWMPKKVGPEVETVEPKAWIAGLKDHVPYDSTAIFRCTRVRRSSAPQTPD